MKRCKGNLRPAPSYLTPELVGRVLAQIGKPRVVESDGQQPHWIPVVALPPAKPKLRTVKSAEETESPPPAPCCPQASVADASAGREAEAGSAVDLPAPNQPRRRGRPPGAQARSWKPEEDQQLRDVYATGGPAKDLERKLGRSLKAIYARAAKLKLVHPKPRWGGFVQGKTWSPEEDDQLRRDYGEVDLDTLSEQLGRSRIALSHRAKILGIEDQYTRDFKRSELQALRIGYERGISVYDIAEALGRGGHTLSKCARRRGMNFGRRKLLAAPISFEQLLALKDPEIPTPVFREACGPRPSPKPHLPSAATKKEKPAAPPTPRERALRIAYDRGIALYDVAVALSEPGGRTAGYAYVLGLHFGRRPVLAEPISLDDLLALEDQSIPIPPLRAAVLRQRKEADRLAARLLPAARQRPASSNPQARAAFDNVDYGADRAKIDLASRRRADAVRRGIMARAERLIDSGKTITKSTNVHVKIAAREIEAQRAEDARQACPIEQAKTVLRRRRPIVCSMSVYDGDPDLFFVAGLGPNITKDQLLAEASKELKRMAR